MLDEDARITIDGADLGNVKKGAGARARVDIGQHLVVATADDVVWRSQVTVLHEGQMLVQSDIGKERERATKARSEVQAADEKRKLVQPWVGRWIADDLYFYSGLVSRWHYDVIELSITEDGTCGYKSSNGAHFPTDRAHASDPRYGYEAKQDARLERADVFHCIIQPDGVVTTLSGTALGIDMTTKKWKHERREEPGPAPGKAVSVSLRRVTNN